MTAPVALSALIAALTARAAVAVSLVDNSLADVAVEAVAHDSRSVRPGTLFCCVRGEHSDGHLYANDAIAAGAVALVVDHRVATSRHVPQLVVADTRAVMGIIAAAVLGYPGDALELIGVTGTNGKTTTAHMLESVLSAAGRSAAVIGTLTQKRTTPEATDLQQRLAELRDAKTQSIVMEVTSHALELHRVDGLRFRVGVFTNLSQDHLDFHPSMEAYFRAKAKLFDPTRTDHAVVNADDLHGRLLIDAATVPTTAYRLSDAQDLVLRPTASSFTFFGQPVTVPLAGAFNVMNALAVATTARHLGIAETAIAAGLSKVVVPGRFEPVDMGQPFGVIVDFAHTPDGLQRVLQAARATLPATGRIIVVFGCGGDRDAAKRPVMGAIAAALADRAVLTSDNPRGEDPLAILNDVRAGMADAVGLVVEPDRRLAIRHGLAIAGPGDTVVIAGKGHETTQEIGDSLIAFDDRVVAREELASMMGVR